MNKISTLSPLAKLLDPHFQAYYDELIVPVGLIIETYKHHHGGILIAVAGTKSVKNGYLPISGMSQLDKSIQHYPVDCWSTSDVLDNMIGSVAGLSVMDTLTYTVPVVINDYLTNNHAVESGTLRLGRMIEFLKSQDITPLVWDGQRPILPSGLCGERQYSTR